MPREHGAEVVRAVKAVAERSDFDVILSDVRMPKLDGPGLHRTTERVVLVGVRSRAADHRHLGGS